MLSLVDKLCERRSLSVDEYERLVAGRTPELAEELARRAVAERKRVWGTKVFARGLIEVSSYCVNDCYYCGIRRSNRQVARYRLSPERILACAEEGYGLGFRTFVLQGGEDPWFSDERLCDIVARVRSAHPDCAVTLSMGERSRASYQALHDAGAERYLLRHETANPLHYRRLHPPEMSFERRMRCLEDIRDIGYAVGIGFMVGSPYQQPRDLAMDLKLVEEFGPQMCGIGPFVAHHATPFASQESGSLELTCYLLSIIRLIGPGILLPATTALGSIHPQGREKGIMSGANVVMPNLSPMAVRQKYLLYDNKAGIGDDGESSLRKLRAQMQEIGYEVAVGRGDYTDGRTKQ